jgi:hypothetical protein
VHNATQHYLCNQFTSLQVNCIKANHTQIDAQLTNSNKFSDTSSALFKIISESTTTQANLSDLLMGSSLRNTAVTQTKNKCSIISQK